MSMRDYYGDDRRGRQLASKIQRMYWAGSISTWERRWLRQHPPRWWTSRSRNGQKSTPEGRETRFAREEVLEDLPL